MHFKVSTVNVPSKINFTHGYNFTRSKKFFIFYVPCMLLIICMSHIYMVKSINGVNFDSLFYAVLAEPIIFTSGDISELHFFQNAFLKNNTWPINTRHITILISRVSDS